MRHKQELQVELTAWKNIKAVLIGMIDEQIQMLSDEIEMVQKEGAKDEQV